MVETAHPPHPPAVKVGGRRLSVSNRPKPHANPEPAPESPTEAREEREDEAPKKEKKHNFDRHAQRKAETSRPTRDSQGSFKAFAGSRIGQPAGKGLGL